jgi:hypothetical protein
MSNRQAILPNSIFGHHDGVISMSDIPVRAGNNQRNFAILDNLGCFLRSSVRETVSSLDSALSYLSIVQPEPQGKQSMPGAHRLGLYQHPQHPLQDIQSDNVWQGELNDCYFLSALSALADKKPNTIKDMIKENPDGTYNVTFPGDRLHPITVASPAGCDLKTNAHYKSGTWTNVIEKAHRKKTNKWSNQKGGCWEPETGGRPIEAIELLTGSRTTNVSLARSNTQALHNFLREATSQKQIIVAARPEELTETIPASSAPPTRLIAAHAYSLLQYDANHQSVLLRDPRGINCGNGSANGRFSLSLKDFQTNFSYLFATELKQ